MEPNVAPPLVTAALARSVVAGAYRALEERKQQVNDLNVYPVPDGDTGTNLLLTVKSIVDELNRAADGTRLPALCDLTANAALMGARGNSGVILSQIVRGAMEALKETEGAPRIDIAGIMRRATDTAYRAVRKPVEGTILTVLREMTEAAEAVAPGTDEAPLLASMVEAGWASVERTPTLLKVLADAGVVDAGGYGLVVLLEGMIGAESLAGDGAAASSMSLPAEDDGNEAHSVYTYCTSFLLRGEGLVGLELERLLQPLGDSLLVVGTDTQIKVHVHTDEPGTVLGLATRMGTLSQVEVDNMRDQTTAREARLRERSFAPVVVGETQVIPVVAGTGVRELFHSLGAGPFVEGGQTMNPSAEDIMRAVSLAEAPGVILLPNNKNIIMAAEQVAELSRKNVVVVPTRSMQAGLSALVSFDAHGSLEENVKAMNEALTQVVTGEVTRAVRDTLVDGVQVTEGSFIGLAEGEVIASTEGLWEAARAVTERLLDGGRELVTVLTGSGAPEEEVLEIAARLQETFSEVEFEIHHGGQPLYPLLLAAE